MAASSDDVPLMSEQEGLREEDEKIPEDFECSLCLNLLLDPVSVACGHTFCRTCINRSSEYRTACPLCRKPVHVGGGVNVLLANIIAERFPKALSVRKQARVGELTQVESRPVKTLPVIQTQEIIVPGASLHIHIIEPEHLLAFQAAVADSASLICQGPIISTVCSVEHLAGDQAAVRGLYRCVSNTESISTREGYSLGNAEEIIDEPINQEELADDNGEIIKMWQEALHLIETRLATMGDSGRATFYQRHNRPPTLTPGDCTAASIIRASWWLSGAIIGPEERLLTVNTKARIEASLQVLREQKNSLVAPFNMPGGTPWAIGTRQSVILLLIILLFAYLKYAGIIGNSHGAHY